MGNRGWYQVSLYETQFKHRITSNTLKIWQRENRESSNLINSQSSNGHPYKPEGCFCFKKSSSSWARKKYPRNRRCLLPSGKVVLFQHCPVLRTGTEIKDWELIKGQKSGTGKWRSRGKNALNSVLPSLPEELLSLITSTKDHWGPQLCMPTM